MGMMTILSLSLLSQIPGSFPVWYGMMDIEMFSPNIELVDLSLGLQVWGDANAPLIIDWVFARKDYTSEPYNEMGFEEVKNTHTEESFILLIPILIAVLVLGSIRYRKET